jgi:L-ascorbate metabolism protein UlaG (beta-lactamase superfamily)
MPIYVKWLGHASFQIKTSDKIIYIDLKKYGKVIETSEKADIILVTHNHGDHCSPPKIEKLRRTNTVIIAPRIVRRESAELLKPSNRKKKSP